MLLPSSNALPSQKTEQLKKMKNRNKTTPTATKETIPEGLKIFYSMVNKDNG
jgi:hypothetical protein